MSTANRTRARSDEGSIILALFGILAVTAIAIVVTASVLKSERVARHDLAFEQSLTTAEEGLDLVTAAVRANPTAASIPGRSGTSPVTGGTWIASASGGSGHWVVTSRGSAGNGAAAVSRTITQHVDVTSLLDVPLWGQHGLTLGTGGTSGVDRYDSRISSAVCTAAGVPSTMGATGSHACIAASPALDRAGTEGPLTMPGAALSRVAGVDIYGAAVPGFADPDATGTCAGDATTCAAVGSSVVTHPQQLPHELSNECANGIGGGVTAYDGSFALAAGAVYNFTNVTLNAQAVASLANLAGTQLVICFSGTLTVPPLVPVNATVGSLLPVTLSPRAPSTLLLVSTAPAAGAPAPVVNFGVGALGALLPQDTSISAVVYAPNADCHAAGHVDLYGALICGTITAATGVDVHSDAALPTTDFDKRITVTTWQEVRPGTP